MIRTVFKNYYLPLQGSLLRQILYTQTAFFSNNKQNKISLYQPPQIKPTPLKNQPTQKDFIDLQTFFSTSELSTNDIQNFNFFYKPKKSIQVQGKSHKKILTKFYHYNIHEILELKLSNNYEKMIYFLRVRKDQLKDEEICYIYEILCQYNMFKKFQHEEPILFNEVWLHASGIKYKKTSTTLRILDVLLAENFFPPKLIRQLYKFYLMRLNEDEDFEFSTILKGLGLLQVPEIRDSLEHLETAVEAQAIKFFLANCLFPQAFEFLQIMDNIHFANNAKFLYRFENYLVECMSHISIQDFTEVFYIFVKSEVKDSVLYINIEDIFKRKFSGLARDAEERAEGYITLATFGKLCWAISQVPTVTENEKLWEKLEDVLLTFIETELKEERHVDKKDVSIILQSFNKANRGTHLFWSFRFEDIVLHNKGSSPYEYNDLIVLLYNRVKRKIYYPEFFEHILEFEKNLKMKYVQDLPLNQFQLTIYTYSVGIELYSGYLKKLKAENPEEAEDKLDDLEDFLAIAGREINKYLRSLRPVHLKSLDQDTFLDIYTSLMCLNDVGLLELSKPALEVLNTEANHKHGRFSFAQLAKFGILVTRFSSKHLHGLNYERVIQTMGEMIQKSLLIEVLDVLPIFIEFNVDNEYLWAVIDFKLIESIESLNANDLIIIGIVYNLLNRGNEEFWELYFESLSECISKASESIVEDGKMAFAVYEDLMELLNRYKPVEIEMMTEEELEEREEYFIKYDEIKQAIVNKASGDGESLINEVILKDI